MCCRCVVDVCVCVLVPKVHGNSWGAGRKTNAVVQLELASSPSDLLKHPGAVSSSDRCCRFTSGYATVCRRASLVCAFGSDRRDPAARLTCGGSPVADAPKQRCPCVVPHDFTGDHIPPLSSPRNYRYRRNSYLHNVCMCERRLVCVCPDFEIIKCTQSTERCQTKCGCSRCRCDICYNLCN